MQESLLQKAKVFDPANGIRTAGGVGIWKRTAKKVGGMQEGNKISLFGCGGRPRSHGRFQISWSEHDEPHASTYFFGSFAIGSEHGISRVFFFLVGFRHRIRGAMDATNSANPRALPLFTLNKTKKKKSDLGALNLQKNKKKKKVQK